MFRYRSNVAFLALPGINAAEITCNAVSTFFSIGSIAVGLHHIWRHRDKRESGAIQAVSYLSWFTQKNLVSDTAAGKLLP